MTKDFEDHTSANTTQSASLDRYNSHAKRVIPSYHLGNWKPRHLMVMRDEMNRKCASGPKMSDEKQTILHRWDAYQFPTCMGLSAASQPSLRLLFDQQLGLVLGFNLSLESP